MNALVRWFLGPCDAGRPAPEGEGEAFGGLLVDPAPAARLLCASPRRERTVGAIRDLIADLPRDRKRELVDRVLLRTALFVFDLPASERNHDSGPSGLLDHSLEVTHRVLESIASANLRLSHDPVANYRERPFWIYAAFAAALLHDAGKVMDVEITSPGGEETWSPRSEPLAHFHARRGSGGTAPENLRFLPGRGMRTHRLWGPAIQALILPPSAIRHAGRRLDFVTEAYCEPPLTDLPPHIPEVARRIADLIRTHDVGCARAGVERTEPLARRSQGPSVSAVAPVSPSPAPSSEPPSPHVFTPDLPVSRPPVGIHEYFANAFRIAIEERRLPVNAPGGIYVGRRYFFLALPRGLETVLAILKERWAMEDEKVRALVSGPSPEGALVGELGAQGWLLEGRGDGSWSHEVEVERAGEQPETCPMMVIKRSMIQSGPPLFPGRIEIKRPREALPAPAGPVPPAAIPAGEPSRETHDPSGVREEDVVREGPAAGPRATLRAKPATRVDELSPPRFVKAVRQLVHSAHLERNLESGDVFIRADYAWFVHPKALKVICRRRSIPCRPEGLDQVVSALASSGLVKPFGDGAPLIVGIRVRGDDPGLRAIKAFRIATPDLFSAEEVASLGTWPGEIEVADGNSRAGSGGEDRR